MLHFATPDSSDGCTRCFQIFSLRLLFEREFFHSLIATCDLCISLNGIYKETGYH